MKQSVPRQQKRGRHFRGDEFAQSSEREIIVRQNIARGPTEYDTDNLSRLYQPAKVYFLKQSVPRQQKRGRHFRGNEFAQSSEREIIVRQNIARGPTEYDTDNLSRLYQPAKVYFLKQSVPRQQKRGRHFRGNEFAQPSEREIIVRQNIARGPTEYDADNLSRLYQPAKVYFLKQSVPRQQKRGRHFRGNEFAQSSEREIIVRQNADRITDKKLCLSCQGCRFFTNNRLARKKETNVTTSKNYKKGSVYGVNFGYK